MPTPEEGAREKINELWRTCPTRLYWRRRLRWTCGVGAVSGDWGGADLVEEKGAVTNGAVVGSSLKVDGVMENPVDVARVWQYVHAVRAGRQG